MVTETATKQKKSDILIQPEANNFLGKRDRIYFSTEDEYDKGDILILGNKSGTMKTTVVVFDSRPPFYGGLVIENEPIQDRMDLTHIHYKL